MKIGKWIKEAMQKPGTGKPETMTEDKPEEMTVEAKEKKEMEEMKDINVTKEMPVKKGNQDLMEVVFIIDRSGSMSGLEVDTIGGFNSTLEKQKQESCKTLWSTVLFDDRHEVVHDRLPIDQVKPLDTDTYYVRGMTALLDAIGRAIHHVRNIHKYARPEDVPGKTLFVITTDGMENASREYTYAKVRQMIEHEKEKYGWEFMFLGANMDAVDVAGRMGIDRSRAATFINDDIGIRKNYEAVSGAMKCMAQAGYIPDQALEEVRKDYAKRSRKRW